MLRKYFSVLVVIVMMSVFATIVNANKVSPPVEAKEVFPPDYCWIGTAVGGFGLETFVGFLVPKTPIPIFLEYGNVVKGAAEGNHRVSLALPDLFGPTWLNFTKSKTETDDSVTISRGFPKTVKFWKTKFSVTVFVAGGKTVSGGLDEGYFGGAGAGILWGI